MRHIALIEYKCNITYKKCKLNTSNDIMLDHVVFILTINYLHDKICITSTRAVAQFVI